jgi:hypothetical protein
MKTIVIKSIMVVIIVIAMVHYALYLKTGRLPWADGRGPSISLPGMPDLNMQRVQELVPSSKTRVYKWVDENGVLNYSQEPPPANVEGQVVEVDANVNIIQSTPVPAPESDQAQGRPRSIFIGEGGTGAEEKTPVEKAQEVKELLEARDREQKKILDSL